jgi:short-subunit dehydrogenase
MRKSYAVITGASSGIGLEFAIQLAGEGYPLILVSRRKERLEGVAWTLRKYGVPVKVIAADLSKKSECYRLMSEIADKKIGIFINNAGFGDCGCFLETDEKKELAMIDLNVKALHLLTKLVIRKMDYQEGGYLLNVASSAGLLPAGPYMATYYATKAYVASLTRAIARELEEIGSNVYIGALCPGPVDTAFNYVANVEFALPGISAEECVAYAIRQMKRRKTVIVPTLSMKAATTLGRLIPPDLSIRLTGHQQKKKF